MKLTWKIKRPNSVWFAYRSNSRIFGEIYRLEDGFKTYCLYNDSLVQNWAKSFDAARYLVKAYHGLQEKLDEPNEKG